MHCGSGYNVMLPHGNTYLNEFSRLCAHCTCTVYIEHEYEMIANFRLIFTKFFNKFARKSSEMVVCGSFDQLR